MPTRLEAGASKAHAIGREGSVAACGDGYEEIVGGHHTPAERRRVVEKVVKRAVI